VAHEFMGTICGLLVTACAAGFLGIAPVVATTDLMVDGKPFRPTQCRNGAALHFMGVEVSDEAGRAMRFDTTNDGRVVIYKAHGTPDVTFYFCGQINIVDQDSTINSVKNVEGRAILKCENQGHTVNGTVTFENCH